MSAARKAAARTIAAQYIAATARARQAAAALRAHQCARHAPLGGGPRRRHGQPARRHPAAQGALRRGRAHAVDRPAPRRGARRRATRARRASSPSSPRCRCRCCSSHTYVGASSRLEGLTWGAEDLSASSAREANREADGRWTSPYRLARDLCLFTAAAAEAAADRHGVRQFPRRGGPARRGARGRARRLHGQDGDPSQPGGRHQRGVHAAAPRRSPSPRRS